MIDTGKVLKCPNCGEEMVRITKTYLIHGSRPAQYVTDDSVYCPACAEITNET